MGVSGGHSRHPTLALDALPGHAHAQDTGSQIAAALGLESESCKLLDSQAGVRRCDAHRSAPLFVTLNKDLRGSMPTTLYHDYSVSTKIFYRRSQSATCPNQKSGRLYKNLRREWRIMLAVPRKARCAENVSRLHVPSSAPGSVAAGRSTGRHFRTLGVAYGASVSDRWPFVPSGRLAAGLGRPGRSEIRLARSLAGRDSLPDHPRFQR